MDNLFDIITSSYSTVSSITLYDKFKTGNPLYDVIITTLLATVSGYIINYIRGFLANYTFVCINIEKICKIFYNTNTIIIEGSKTFSTCRYDGPSTSAIYSNRFKAICEHIISNIDKLDTVHQIKETYCTFQSSGIGEDRNKPCDIYMINQEKSILLDENIFVRVDIDYQDYEGQGQDTKTNAKTEKITLHIYSYVHTISYLKVYIENITAKFIASIKENRENSRFIYSLDNTDIDEEDGVFKCWQEYKFESSRTFKNMFFDGKQELVERVDHFLLNRDWYDSKGIPYSLGIGLHGPPGTGKTSFIKAVAKYTNRHIIVIPLKLIKTKKQLETFFFEDRYSGDNSRNSIPFDKKIIVFEDIDCIGDIVMERSKKNCKVNTRSSMSTITTSKCEGDNLKSSNIVIKQEGDNLKSSKICIKQPEDPITLDDILNLWDGIRETPGRILIISSNHYNKLDSALTRPGRIDISHELTNASHKTITDIYYNLFKKSINKTVLRSIKEYFYSPAELVNLYVQYQDANLFVKRLMENKKVQ